MDKKCPACGGTNLSDEPGKNALLKVTETDAIQIDVGDSTMNVMTVNAKICGDCGFVSFYDAP